VAIDINIQYHTNAADKAVRRSTPGAGNLFQCITSHPGHLSLAILPWVGAMSISQRAVMLCGGALAVLGLSVWGASEGPLFWVGALQSEQLQVSYYEPYYASLWF